MRHLSFRQRQFLVLLGLAMVLLVTAAAASLTISRNTIIRHTTAQLETVADLKTVQVHQWLDQGRAVARLVSNLREVQEEFPVLLAAPNAEALALAQADLYAELETVSAILPSARSVSLLHPASGHVLLSADPAQEGRERRDEDYFRQGQQALYVSPVAYSVGHEAPVLIVSAPMRDESGALLAVVVVEMDLADLDAALGGRAGLGQTGQAYLVEGYGFYVTLPPDVEASPLRTIARSEGVRRALDGQNGSDTYLDPRGVPVLGVYRWLPEENLGLLVEIEEAELTGQIRRAGTSVVLASVGALALAAVVARYLTNWLVTPLEQIAEAARALRAGDLSHRAPSGDSAPPGRADEISQLATAFNDMAASLQRYYENLEELVKERTAELQREIIERKRAEEQIKASLLEKEVLLQELYHRTKNNMQVISSMLALQAAYTQDERVIRIFQDTENRIRAMALVHQKLVQSADLSSIDLSEYIRDLVDLLRASHGVYLDRIDVVLDVESISVLMDIAVPCGLMLNELISNSFEHAFAKDVRGEIRIRFHRAKTGEIELEVSDNGVGVPEGFDFRNSDTLGLQSVFAIGEHQLGGKVTFESCDGITCQIRFKDTLYSRRV
ncbi:MAG: histidine kinase dimerization/phosphoacceptor domain -containing protein [Anaerolineae bacterium]